MAIYAEPGERDVGRGDAELGVLLGGVKALQGEAYFFAAAPEAFDYGPAQLEGEGWLWGIGAGDGVARACGADHCVSGGVMGVKVLQWGGNR